MLFYFSFSKSDHMLDLI